jgi:hypothetical protein
MVNIVYIVPLVLALTGMLLTGTQPAHATNENSYQFGFQHGKIEYGHCTYRGDQDEYCAAGYNVCTEDTSVTNVTACVDGFVNGWNHICDPAQARTWPNNEVPCPTTVEREVQ